MFTGNKDSSNVVTNILDPHISRLVVLRILPKSTNGGVACLQLEVLGCNADPVPTVKNNPGRSQKQ